LKAFFVLSGSRAVQRGQEISLAPSAKPRAELNRCRDATLFHELAKLAMVDPKQGGHLVWKKNLNVGC
jgi:hypothetical protein